MNRKTWMVGALYATLLPLAALAQPDGAPEMHFHGGHGPDSALLQGVTLTDTQRSQIETIHETNWATAKPLMQQLHATEEQITAALLASGSVNSSQLAALQSTASSLRAQLDQQRLSTELQVRALLSSTQLAQAAATHTQIESLHQQMHSLMHAGAQSSTEQ